MVTLRATRGTETVLVQSFDNVTAMSMHLHRLFTENPDCEISVKEDGVTILSVSPSPRTAVKSC